MGSPNELFVSLLLIVVIGVVVIAIARQFFGKPTSDYEDATKHLNRPSIRRAVMRLAEFLAVVQVILLTVGGAIGGGLYAGFMAGLANQNVQGAQATGALIGGAGGFLSAMVLTGLLFTLAAIEENTRTTATMLSILARPRTPSA
jgi:cytosine/uracil/thiamine/allantoin permease